MAAEEADIEEELDEEAEEGDGDGPKKKKLSGKKIIIIAAAVLLVIGLAVGAAWFFGLFGSGEHENPEEAAQQEKENAQDVVFYELPEILVTLNSGGRSSNYLKMKITLELEDKEATEHLEAVLPRIIDNFQVYLRELRLEDLNGSAGLFRLKEELLIRVNAAVHPVHVNDVLFKEMLVQ